MTQFKNFSEDENIEGAINKITADCPVREQAFFTIMRQSGLTPNMIKRLKVGDLEPDFPIPCKIDITNEQTEVPAFIGEEGVRYLQQYLATRKNPKPESPLFTAHNDQNREINTQNVSRTFRLAAEKTGKGRTKRLRLYSLVKFYRQKTKTYNEQLKNHPFGDDELFKTLYKKHALPFLEIEGNITIQRRAPSQWFHNRIESQEKQIKELSQTITRSREYLSSILSLLYDNSGDWETGENVKLADRFIELWQKVVDVQLMNQVEFLNGRSEYIPLVNILEELTKTLQSILKPYEELSRDKDAQTKSNVVG